jgi:hypothetical protein
MAGVTCELLQSSPAPSDARVFLNQRDVPEFTACCPSGLVRCQSVILMLFRFLLKVELEFLAQLGFFV